MVTGAVVDEMGYYIPDDMWEALEEQPKKVQNEVFGAVARLFFTGEEDALTGTSKALFIAFRDRVRKSRTNAGNRKKETGNETANETRKETRNETHNETGNETANETRTDAEGNPESAIKGGGGEELPNGNSTPKPPYAEIVGRLNARTGKAFKATSEATRKLIRARWEEGYRLDDFAAVIDSRAALWGNSPKMREFLRPSTLFRASKFEEYLAEAGKGVRDASPYAAAW